MKQDVRRFLEFKGREGELGTATLSVLRGLIGHHKCITMAIDVDKAMASVWMQFREDIIVHHSLKEKG